MATWLEAQNQKKLRFPGQKITNRTETSDVSLFERDQVTELKVFKKAELPSFRAVKSANIAKIGFKAEEGTLFVEFIGGDLYVYRNVTDIMVDEMEHSPSVGSYLSQKIKKFPEKFPVEKVVIDSTN